MAAALHAAHLVEKGGRFYDSRYFNGSKQRGKCNDFLLVLLPIRIGWFILTDLDVP